MLRNVTLHGPLSARFGSQTIALYANDFQELIRGLNCAYPGFSREVLKHDEMVVALAGPSGMSFIGPDTLGWSFADKQDIHLATSEKGQWEAAAYAANAVAFAAADAGASLLVAHMVYGAVYVATALAISYAIGSIAQSLADKPSTDSRQGKEQQSAIFDQAVNLEGQGHPIPLVYGLFKVGSVVISADVISEKNVIAVSDSFTSEYGAPITGNLFANDIDGGTMELNSFIVAGTSYSPGATAVVGNISVTVNVDGGISITTVGTTEESLEFTYLATSDTAAKTEARVRVTFAFPQTWSTSDGG